jgi:DNA helicase HerA-like ATPase
MLLGKIFGKVTTTEFKFLVEHETRKFEYVQVYHPVYEFVLCQIIEIEKQEEMTTALCQIIGFKDKDGKIKKLRIPFEPGSEVFIAEDDFISQIIKLDDPDSGAYIGKLDGKDIKISLDLKKLLTKHVAILAKSGSGKSYTVGVLLEEIIEKNVPLLIIDPHGEYASMAKLNDNENEIKDMAYFDIKPKKFSVNEYGDTTINPHAKPLRISNKLSAKTIMVAVSIIVILVSLRSIGKFLMGL